MCAPLGKYRKFTYRCSGKLSVSNVEEIIGTCLLRYQWHRAWIYGTPPDIELPGNMPIPNDIQRAGGIARRVTRPPSTITQPNRPCDIFEEAFPEDAHIPDLEHPEDASLSSATSDYPEETDIDDELSRKGRYRLLMVVSLLMFYIVTRNLAIDPHTPLFRLLVQARRLCLKVQIFAIPHI